MSISLYKIKKWYKMLAGKSVLHVPQGVGTCYSKQEVAGYYNDLTEKVLRDDPDILVPRYYMDNGELLEFSIGIFQYGLAAYDLYLTTHQQVYQAKLLACAQWALENQQSDGGWVTFAHTNPHAPYSSMAQGEGISMLLRAAIVSGDPRFTDAAEKAKVFMLKPLGEGGTTEYDGEDVIFYEDTDSPVILNGWIFSLWGLLDYCNYTGDNGTRAILERTLNTLKKKLPEFDIRYWSNYDVGGHICSPFYHQLHIAQLRVMYDLFGDPIYEATANRWELYQASRWNKARAFLKKAVQKILE